MELGLLRLVFDLTTRILDRFGSPVRWFRRQPSLPDLVYDFDRKYTVYKGYVPTWHFGVGHYESQEGFLWLEYECKKDKPSRVQIQVEGPNQHMDAEWSGAKESLFREVLGVFEAVSAEVGPRAEKGQRATIASVRANRATTVFTVAEAEINTDDWRHVAKEAITATHDQIGRELHAAWKRWYERTSPERLPS